MPSILECLGIGVAAFWLALTLDRKRCWPREVLRSGPPAETRSDDSLLVVVPARNEAAVLPRTLPSLSAQSDAFALLVVVDDRSADGTGAAARAAAGDEPRVQVIAGEPPREGWSGKLHALEAGIEHGRRAIASGGGRAPGWLLFTDADILHPPRSIAALLRKAGEGPHDLVSVMARLRAESTWEKLLIPPFLWFFHLLYPFRRVADPRSGVAAAAGGCILVRSEALERAGGLEPIRGEVIDDVALARRVKRSGGRIWLGLDPGLASLRAYETLGEIVDLVARTAFTQLRHSVLLLAGTLAFLGIFFAGPPAIAVAGVIAEEPLAAGLGAAAWAVQALLYLPAVRHSRVSPLIAATLPVASAIYGAMTAVSAWRHWRGRGAEWKGRTYGGRKTS